MDYQTIIESFFCMLGRFDFDRAKTYIDGRKDVLQRLAPTFPNQLQLMTMLTTFSHLAEVEKNYHNQPNLNHKEHHSHHSFLISASFLRKPKSLKDMYHEIHAELQLLEQIETNQNKSAATNQPVTMTNCNPSDITATTSSPVITSSTSSPLASVKSNSSIVSHPPKLSNKQQSTDSVINSDQNSTNSSSTEKDSPIMQTPQSPGSALRNSFFRVLSPISSSAAAASSISNQQSFNPSLSSSSRSASRQISTFHQNQSNTTCTPNSVTPLRITNSCNVSTSSANISSVHSTNVSDPYSMSSSSGYEPPPNSSTSTPIGGFNVREFSEELILHFCRQLQNFVQARLDLIDVYEKLIEASNKKYASVDGISFKLSMLCRQYQKYFHHPLLAPIKEGMTLECESLMTLIKATIDMQHWRFLPTLYDLHDAQSKLSYWAASTFNKESTRRRFKVSKTLTAPKLYEWLCRFKDFLLAKFTLYFHAALTNNLPAQNIKLACSKLSVDYYNKLVNFQKKIDAQFVILLYDVSNEKDFQGPLGYYYPSKDLKQPQGKSTLQPMVVIPAISGLSGTTTTTTNTNTNANLNTQQTNSVSITTSTTIANQTSSSSNNSNSNSNAAFVGDTKARQQQQHLQNLQAELYMITMTNQQTMIKDGHYQFHDNIKRLTYCISKPDLNVVLAIVCEGQKPDRDASVRTFCTEFTNQFAFLNIFIS